MESLVQIGQYTIKDIILTIFSTISICLAIASMVRVTRNDRRLRLEPYFKTLWRKKSSGLNSMTTRVTVALQSMKSAVQAHDVVGADYLDALNTDGIGINIHNWEYDRTFHRKLLSLDKSLTAIAIYAKRYNSISELTSGNVSLALQLDNIGIYDGLDADLPSEESTARKEKFDGIRERLRQAIITYKLSDSPTFGELRDNPQYQKDQRQIAYQVRTQIDRAEKIVGSLRSDIDFYDFAFLDPEGSG